MEKNNDEVNWCGGKWSWFKPPYHIFFNTSCNKHDELYNEWWDSFDRWIADIYLLKFMLQDCLLIENKLRKVYYSIWCFIYYVAVRLFGKKYFNFIKQ